MRVILSLITLMALSTSYASVTMSFGGPMDKVKNCPICLVPEIIIPDEVQVHELAQSLEVELKYKGEVLEAFATNKSGLIEKEFDNGESLTLNINKDSLALTIYMENQSPINYKLQAK